jgi:hypothetical protein
MVEKYLPWDWPCLVLDILEPPRLSPNETENFHGCIHNKEYSLQFSVHQFLKRKAAVIMNIVFIKHNWNCIIDDILSSVGCFLIQMSGV